MGLFFQIFFFSKLSHVIKVSLQNKQPQFLILHHYVMKVSKQPELLGKL